MESADKSVSSVTILTDVMAKAKGNSHQTTRRVPSASGANASKLPDTHWAHAVAMLTQTIKASEPESKKPMSKEDFPETADLEIVRVRALSNQI